MNLKHLKDLVDTLYPATTIVGIFVGALWTYLLFIAKRQVYPRLKIQHNVSWRNTGDKTFLLSVDVVMTNIGDVLVPLSSGWTEVIQLLPLEDTTYQKNFRVNTPSHDMFGLTQLAVQSEERERQIEPTEVDQVHYEFLIPIGTCKIRVYTHYTNRKAFWLQTKTLLRIRRPKIGWECFSVHDLQTG